MKRVAGLSAVAFLSGLLSIAGVQPVAGQELLLRDDFDVVGDVDSTVWRLPFDTEGTFVGRTQYRGDPSVDLPQQGVAEAGTDGVLELHLDSYSPIDPGNAFLGTDLLTKRNFARGGGVSIEARMRLKPTTVGGAVGGFFLYDVSRDSPPGANNLVRDEIDWELISNQAVGAASQDPATNLWNDGPFSDGGDLQFHDVAGFDLTQFNDYKVEWTPQAVTWSVNGQVVRVETDNVPDDPMKLHFNVWAPNSDFEDAFNAALMPTAVEGDNQRITAQIDYVEVNRFDTEVSDNLLTNPSFEAADFTGWNSFGNVFVEPDDPGGNSDAVPDTAPDGIFMAKAFGPFFTPGAASGMIQSVPAVAGEEFEASIEVTTPVGDSILGTENFNLLVLRFLDDSGQILTEEFADPANFVDTNGQSFPLLDGRDPLAEADVWYEGTVSAVAPADTAAVEYGVFFIQLASDGGAAFYDNASLVKLTSLAPEFLLGDADGDGDVDGDDLIAVQTQFGDTGMAPLLGDADFDGDVDGDDLIAVQTNFGATSGGAVSSAIAAPEPSTAGLALLIGFAAASRIRRRG